MGSRSLVKIILWVVILLLNITINSKAAVPEYDATEATVYADTWWGITGLQNQNKWKIYNSWRNTNEGDDDLSEIEENGVTRNLPKYTTPYFNHYMRPDADGNWFTDCAHFVSQCLIAGGLRDEMNDFISRISRKQPSDTTNKTLRDYGGLIFEDGSNAHNPNSGYIAYPAGTTIAAYSQTMSNNEWSVIVNTRPRNAGIYKDNDGIYENELSLMSYLLHEYHAQYFYGQRPTDLAAGDVFFPTKKHATIINKNSADESKLVYTAHNTDVRDEPIPSNFKADRHFFHMVRSVPYVKKVILKQNEKTIYQAQWNENEERTVSVLESVPAKAADISANITIKVIRDVHELET